MAEEGTRAISGRTDVYPCGCRKCIDNGDPGVPYSTWYRHQKNYRKELAAGTIQPRDPSLRVPSKRKRAMVATPEPDERQVRQRVNTPAESRQTERDGDAPHTSGTPAASGPPSLDNTPNDAMAADAEPFSTVQDFSPQRPHPESFSPPPSPRREDPPELPPPPPPPALQERHASTGSSSDVSEETSRIENVQTTLKFIHALESDPRLADDNLDPDTLCRLSDPLKAPPALTPDEKLSIRLFLADTDGSDKIYNDTRSAILECHPEDEILSLYQVKKKITEITGITEIVNDMCPNNCIGYTGPYATLDQCPTCREPRYTSPAGRPKPQRQFTTFPIGPQIQAHYRSPASAQEMRFRDGRMANIVAELEASGKLDEIMDIYEGYDFCDAVKRGLLRSDDVALIFSMDGAQLYEHKASNCWIYIWILVDVSPNKRYKKRFILPGAIIPGPNKPKNVDSFLFPGLHHVAALQNEGLVIWDASRDIVFTSRPFILLAEADAVGAPDLTGYVGHHGKHGCRNGCRRPGRRKPGGSHYYSVCLKPDGYDEDGCNADDYEPSELVIASPADYEKDVESLRESPSQRVYEQRRLETGISKPSLFLGISPQHRLSIPGLFPGDIMHLFGLNIPDLLTKLWRGTMDCDTKQGDNKTLWDWVCLTGDVWKQHGADVAKASRFLPGFFDRPPRNPAEKISSGYKCWEFLNWIYGLAPGMLYTILPLPYWKNYCMFVAGVRTMYRKRTVDKQRQEAHVHFSNFIHDFESLYVQRKVSRMHFCPQCMHALLHTPLETFRIGPLICTSQFPIERAIGDFGSEIQQPSNPYANLTQRALRRAQVNGLKAMFPELDPTPPILSPNMPHHDLGGGLALLHPREDRCRDVLDCERDAITAYLDKHGNLAATQEWLDTPAVRRWARLRLPNGSICRSSWRETARTQQSRTARNVKFTTRDGAEERTCFGEVRYYFRMDTPAVQADGPGAPVSYQTRTLALVSQYSEPHSDLLEMSSGTVWACHARGDHGLCVIDVKDIVSCVAMIPHRPLPCVPGYTSVPYFVMEKLGGDGVFMEEDTNDDIYD